MLRSVARRTALAAGVLLVGAVTAGPAAAKPVTWFGVYTQEITPELREGLNYNGAGVLVSRVVSGSPADRAGVQRGDVITRLGSRAIESHDQLADLVRQSPSGRMMDLQIVREGRRQVLTVTLASREESEFDGDSPGDRRDDPDDDRGSQDFEAPAPPAPPRTMRIGPGDHEIEIPDMHAMMGRGRLGVRIQELNPDLADYFGSRTTKGALVVDVTEGSAAEKAGVRSGDIITKIGNRPIDDTDDLLEAVRSSEGKVSITVLRHGASRTLEATLDPVPQTMQYRRGPNSFRWRTQGPNSRELRDRARDQRGDDEELRRMVDDLKKEVQELRQQLEEENGRK